MKYFEEAITISSGDFTADIMPSLGANVVRFAKGERDILRPLKSTEQFNENHFLQGTPILLPANRTANAKFEFDGTAYTLDLNEPKYNNNLHGSAYLQNFKLVSKSADTVICSYENHGEIYPFDFAMKTEATVKSDGLYQKFTITNLGKKTMPYTFALHTTFEEPKRFDVMIDRYVERNEEQLIPTGPLSALNDVQRGFRDGSASHGVGVIGYYTASGNVAHIDDVTYTVSGNFDQWILFNGYGEGGFLCVEPQAGEVNGLNKPGGCKTLKPGDSVVYETKITV